MKRTTLLSLIQSMQQKNVVEVVRDTTSPGCYSHLFLVPKKSGGWRPVIDLLFLNSFLEIPHFTMESAESIRRSLPRDAWVTSIDLVDAYFHIPIHRGYRKFLRFQTRDRIYQFWALPFGLSPAPWVFTKIMTEIKMLVHVMGINLCQYLDDWLIYSPSHDQCLRDTVQVLNLCHTMGLLIHDKKLELIPTQKFLFLGYQFDLVSFQVTPTLDRYKNIKALIRSFLLSQGACAHTWQVLIGLFAQKTGSSGTTTHPRSPTLHLATLGFRYFNQQLVDTSFSTGGGRASMVEISTQCSEESSCHPDRTRHPIVHRCIEHRLGSTLEYIDGVRCMDNNRENTPHQHTRVRSHTQSHAPLAAEAYGCDSPSCVRQFHCSILHQQVGRNTVNTAVQTDQEATPHVSGQPNSASGTTHPGEIEHPCRHPVTPF